MSTQQLLKDLAKAAFQLRAVQAAMGIEPIMDAHSQVCGEHHEPDAGELWAEYCKYLDAGDPNIPDADWDCACLTWREWKDAVGIYDEKN